MTEIAKLLEKQGQNVSVTEHFGYVTHWQVIGPFDSTDGAGYAKAYPPEANAAGGLKPAGKDGKELEWRPLVTTDKSGPSI